MGTPGYEIYRYKGFYFIYHHSHDGYPSSLGMEIIKKIDVPREANKYHTWLEEQRQKLDTWRQESYDPNNDDPDVEHEYDWNSDIQVHELRVSTKYPTGYVHYEWLYEVDFDWEVFSIQGWPMFRLSNLPRTYPRLVRSIGYDHYGHPACRWSMREYVYERKAIPCKPSEHKLQVYSTHVSNGCRDAGLPVHEVLGLPESLSTCERTREAVYEVIMGYMLHSTALGKITRNMEPMSTAEELSPDQIWFLTDMLNIVLQGPMVMQNNKMHHIPQERSSHRLIWVHEDICLLFHMCLDDERNMHAALGDLFAAVTDSAKDRQCIYGVVTSAFHCVIARIDIVERTFKHTPVMQLLPSNYTMSPSTPGITALVRLGSLPFDSLIGKFADELDHRHRFEAKADNQPPARLVPLILDKLPTEVLVMIGQFLLSPADVLSYIRASQATQSLAPAFLRQPYIGKYCLLAPINSCVPSFPTPDGLLEDDPALQALASAHFVALSSSGKKVRLQFGPLNCSSRQVTVDQSVSPVDYEVDALWGEHPYNVFRSSRFGGYCIGARSPGLSPAASWSFDLGGSFNDYSIKRPVRGFFVLNCFASELV